MCRAYVTKTSIASQVREIVWKHTNSCVVLLVEDLIKEHILILCSYC